MSILDNLRPAPDRVASLERYRELAQGGGARCSMPGGERLTPGLIYRNVAAGAAS